MTGVDNSLSLDNLTSIWARVQPNFHEWYWFDLSGSIPGNELIDCEKWLPICRPPFEKTMVVYRTVRDGVQHEMLLMLRGTDPAEHIRFATAIRLGDGEPRLLKPRHYSVRDGRLYTDVSPDESEHDTQSRDMGLRLIALLYKCLAESRQTAHLAVAEKTFLNQRRIEKGKPPKYTWHTLVVGAETVMREDLGGTHASPRYHDRRGHQRRLRNGKTIWVKACKVGDPSKGAVFKDYAVRTLQ